MSAAPTANAIVRGCDRKIFFVVLEGFRFGAAFSDVVRPLRVCIRARARTFFLSHLRPPLPQRLRVLEQPGNDRNSVGTRCYGVR